MDAETYRQFLIAALIVGGFLGSARVQRELRKRRYTRGRRVQGDGGPPRIRSDDIRFGNTILPRSAATQHFLTAGTSGGGKSSVQRLMMADVLCSIREGTDRRCLILDAKNDIVPFARKVEVTCPLYSFNPFESRVDMPRTVAPDFARDVTSPARALNIASGMFPQEKGGNNRYWTDAGRLAVTAVIESFIRHTKDDWTFSDLVFTCLSQERIETVLGRDEQGRDSRNQIFGDTDTAYKVFTTIASRMAYFKSVAALWQGVPKKRRLSIREWLNSDSILLLGVNATARTALDAINEVLFRIVVEEIDMQPNSENRETWVWIDEARLAGPLLRGDLVPYFAIKARSKGGALSISFQSIEGFEDACGSDKVAHEIVGQCKHKFFGRQESERSAKFASALCGQFETIETFNSESGELTRRSRSVNEQRVMKDEVLVSEFLNLPLPTKQDGLTGMFLSPKHAGMQTIAPEDIEKVIVAEDAEREHGFHPRDEACQWLKPWTADDEKRLLIRVSSPQVDGSPEDGTWSPKKLRLKRNGNERPAIAALLGD